MNIAVLDVHGLQTCFGSAASAFENIELADIHCALKKSFSVTLKGYIRFTDLRPPAKKLASLVEVVLF